jgi:two-component system LytT family response regulator
MSNSIPTIIVDDEPLARTMIKEYLRDFPEIEIIGECGNGKQAVNAINERKPDLVFLDIRMPGMDGFEVLEHLDIMPRIIFTTAHGDYALKAFDVNAVDYLLKPYDRKRFSTAIRRAIGRTAASSDETDRMVQVLQQSRGPDESLKRIFVRVGRKIVSIQLDDVVWIEADGDYTRLHTNGGAHLCNLSMHAFERRLDSGRFLRVHRSFIVAANAIDQLRGDGEGGFVALLKDKSTVKVSRTYAAKLKKNIW